MQDALLSGCQWQWFLEDKAISHGGDTSGGMFGLAPGSVSAIPGLGVPDAPIIHIVSAPFWYGTNPLIGATPRSMTVAARSPCLAARVPQHALIAPFDADPSRWRCIAQYFKAIVLSQLVASDMLIRDSRRCCLAAFLRVANCRTGGTEPSTAELSQDELAAMANLSRQTTGPILREFADAGLVTDGSRNIVLHDLAALRARLAER